MTAADPLNGMDVADPLVGGGKPPTAAGGQPAGGARDAPGGDLAAQIKKADQEIAAARADVEKCEANGDTLLMKAAVKRLEEAIAAKQALLPFGTENSADVADAEEVLKRSNAREDDQTWQILNGGSDKLSAKKGERPDEWSNGFQIKDGKVALNRQGYETDIDTLDEYRKMLKKDFDFSGTISAFLKKGPDAEAAFVSAMKKKYGQAEGANVKLIEHLAKNIWSYATTGADVKGNTSIQQMQGMLYALDAEIRESSDSNTPMSENEFVVPGSEDIRLKQGDGLHGRATTLTTRHILGDLETYDEDAETDKETDKETEVELEVESAQELETAVKDLSEDCEGDIEVEEIDSDEDSEVGIDEDQDQDEDEDVESEDEDVEPSEDEDVESSERETSSSTTATERKKTKSTRRKSRSKVRSGPKLKTRLKRGKYKVGKFFKRVFRRRGKKKFKTILCPKF